HQFAPVVDTVTQTAANSPSLQTPAASLEFEGLGQTDQFFCNCAPPDNDGAPGTTQYVQYVNTFWKVWDKTGHVVQASAPGNTFWSGFGGACQTHNDGDPIIRFDAAAGRWVASQFAIIIGQPMFECVAVSKTSDATGAYNRYAFQINAFPDYPKMGVWPDAYYFTFDDFDEFGQNYLQANVCATDRTNMIAGNAARDMQCFLQTANDFGMLPSDLDGPTAPPAGTPNFVMELDPIDNTKLDMWKFHVDFTTPANSTFTGPTKLTVAAYTELCGTIFRTQCVPQPSPGGTLESLGDRMMYRLVYRNFGDHSALLASHSVLTNNVGGIRWYEMRNPETSLTLFQQGTFQPDTAWRFMPAIAMDKNQDIAIGYTRTGPSAGLVPSLYYAGRMPSDNPGTMEAEQVMKAGVGVQTGGLARWGDYTSLTIDPTDDCTFWFTEEYLAANGSFNWHTAVGNFVFPGCTGQAQPAVTLQPKSLSLAKTLLGSTSPAQKVKLTNSGNANLLISSIAISGDFNQTNNCPISPATLAPSAFCTITVTFTPTAINKRTGAITITDNAPNSPQSVPLSGVGTIVSYSPKSFAFGTVSVGTQSAPQTVTLKNNSSTVTLTLGTTAITGLAKGDYVITANSCVGSVAPLGTCSTSVAFKPTVTGKRNATLNINYTNGGGSPATVSMSGTGQ
ncbi:MAG TPA: choice-of-anchor D domain-containing protein, partial [Terriglobales bacterium]|nr:choice-of-anchor D domain-containing protein [Terriglobales bacterium]